MREEDLPAGVVRLSDRRKAVPAKGAGEAPPPTRIRANNVVRAEGAFKRDTRVLLLEPDAKLRDVLQSYLRTKGFEVVIPDDPALDVLNLPGVTAPPQSDKDRYDAVIYGDISAPAMHEIAPYLLLAWKMAYQRQDKTLPVITLTDNLELLAALNPLRHERSALPQAEGIWRGYFFENGILCKNNRNILRNIEHRLKERIGCNRPPEQQNSR